MNLKKHHLAIGFMAATLLLGAVRDFMANSHPFMVPVLAAEKEVMKMVRPTGIVEFPDVAVAESGDTLIVWQEKTGTHYDVMAARVDSKGYPVTLPFRVNRYSVNDQKFPRIAMNGAGSAVVVWQSYGQDETNSAGIFAQRFGPDLETVGAEFRVNTTSEGNQMSPDVAMDSEGNFTVVWTGEFRDKAQDTWKTVYVQQYNKEGVAIGAETALSEAISGQLKINPSVAMSSKGDVMALWQSSVKNSWELHGRVWGAGSLASGGMEVVPSPDSAARRTRPRVTAMPSGQFLAVWEEYRAIEEAKGIILQKENIRGLVMNAQGVGSGVAFDVNPPARSHHETPDVTALPDGAVVVWQKTEEKKPRETDFNEVWSVAIQRLEASGAPKGGLIQIEEDEFEWMPVVGSNTQGMATVMWQEYDLETKRGVLQFKSLQLESPEAPSDSGEASRVPTGPTARRGGLFGLRALLSNNR